MGLKWSGKCWNLYRTASDGYAVAVRLYLSLSRFPNFVSVHSVPCSPLSSHPDPLALPQTFKHTLTLGPFTCCLSFSFTSACSSLPQYSEGLAPSYRHMSLCQRGLYKAVVTPFTLLSHIFIVLYFLHYTFHIGSIFGPLFVWYPPLLGWPTAWGWDVASSVLRQASHRQTGAEGHPGFFSGREAPWEDGICSVHAVPWSLGERLVHRGVQIRVC